MKTDTMRRLKHFFKSGMLSLGLDHFLAMFPATVMVPLVINNRFNSTIIGIPLVLLTSGLGTLLFLCISKGKIPAYLGSSFAYIGLTIILISNFKDKNIPPQTAYAYVLWAYAFAGILLLLLSLIYRTKNISNILTLILPAPIIGPAISLIGLELANSAALDAGFSIDGSFDKSSLIISMTTLLVIITLSVSQLRILKQAAIFIGVFAGCISAMIVNGMPKYVDSSVYVFQIPDLTFPFLTLPPNLISLFIAIIPATLVIFTENISRVTIINGIKVGGSSNKTIFSNNNIRLFNKSLVSHGMSVLLASFLGSVPNTLYAENIAVMSIHNSDSRECDHLTHEKDRFIKRLYDPSSFVPYIVAAVIAILVSLFGVLQNLLLSIPKPVIGGVELFLFGIIAAPGIQLLVEQKVNYRKISNLMLTASVLITGISNITFNFGVVVLKGMSLGLVVGITLNLIFRFLNLIGALNEIITFHELFILCIHDFPKLKVVSFVGDYSGNNIISLLDKSTGDESHNISQNIEFKDFPVASLVKVLTEDEDEMIDTNDRRYSKNFIEDIIKNSTYAIISDINLNPVFHLQRTVNNQYLYINCRCLEEDTINEWINDYRNYIDKVNANYIRISANGQFSAGKLKYFIRSVRLNSNSNSV